MFWQWDFFGLHGEPEVEFFSVFFVFQADMLLEFAEVDDGFVFAGKMADSGHNLEGIGQIDAENAIEKAGNEAEFDVVCEPVEPFENLRVN